MMELLGDWFAFLPTLLLTVTLLGLPGLALGLALRLRGWWLAAAAAPLSVSLITVASIVGGWLSVPWTVLPVLGLTLVAVVAAVAWQRWVGVRAPRTRRGPVGPSRRWAAAIGVTLPGLVIGFILARGMGEPTRIAQRYDNFFHLNAIQYVLDTGNASPFWVGSMTAPGNLLFYPSGWHAVGSLIAQLAGTGVPAASNALVLVVAALVWPLSLIVLARTLFGASAVITVVAGVLSAATPAFPYLPLHYGTLYPLFLGLALVPVGIAAMIRASRPHRCPRRHDLVLLLVLLVPGISVAHPGALLGMLALSVPAVVMLGWWLWRAFPARRTRISVVAGAAFLLALGVLTLRFLRPPATEIYWPVSGSLANAIGEVVSAAVFNYPVAAMLAVLGLIGVVAAIRHPSYGRSVALGMGIVGAALYIVVAGSPVEILRTWLSGPWYNNPPRLASIWAIAALPLAASGATVLARWIRRRSKTMRFGMSRFQGAPALGALGVVLLLLTQGAAVRQAAADIEYVYGPNGEVDGPILSVGEYDLLLELDEHTPKDAVIAGDPWTGTSFAYALSGRRVLMPHLLMDETSAAERINTGFATDADDPSLCEALEETGVTYILDFAGGPFMDNQGGFEGVEKLSRSPYVRLVAEEAGARLYEVIACGLVR
ncbi:DUF6541 family protein [Microbacterium sp. AK031]|uniref:DUF6541 family protein n=1 Tax=Microbacterium sp. AK031 TaxID=2723076 RepID=UPI002169DAC3|nr:DUF6541 family protein [Microbacterium sp. AK031]MCS3842094.1 hypothetical protein [Microbacterium sp. AK031]